MAEATNRLLEICVDNAAGLDAAIKGGADRIELCSALGLGGLTPSHGLMRHAAETRRVPVYVLIRPRVGDFDYSGEEIAMMEDDIARARDLGLDGVVIGATGADGRLDVETLRRLIAAAKGLGMTLHRAFDMVKDPIDALDTVIDLGLGRILTSGCARNVKSGMATLEALADHAEGRVSIMPGGGVTAELVPHLLALPGIREIHASGSSSTAEEPSLVAFGFSAPERRQTDRSVVERLKMSLLS